MSIKRKRIIEIYRTVHQQGFVPIFVDDDTDSRKMVELCVKAGFKAIEYTLRRKDAAEMIPWIRNNYPDLILLVGSTIDSDEVIKRYNFRNDSKLLTLEELADMDVHGFVSIQNFTESTLRTYSSKYLMIPAVYTINESLRQFEAGAHFLKMLGPKFDLVKLARSAPTFGYCPIFVTGGMILEQIPTAVESGAVLIGTGLPLILNEIHSSVKTDKEIVQIFEKYQQTMTNSMVKKYPFLELSHESDMREWLNELPHQHPFNEELI